MPLEKRKSRTVKIHRPVVNRPDARSLAGRFAPFVGTLTREEAAEMQAAMDEAFETISDDW